jgi:hypothetical protein
MPWSWRCCGIQSGKFRSYTQYLRSVTNHAQWYHYGNISNYSTNGFTSMPYPVRRFPARPVPKR